MNLDPACHLIQMLSLQDVLLDQFAEELSEHTSTWMMNFQLNQQLQQLQIGHLKGGIDHVSDSYKHSKPACKSLITNLASLDPTYNDVLTLLMIVRVGPDHMSQTAVLTPLLKFHLFYKYLQNDQCFVNKL